MLRNLRVRNRKANYRLARRASIISHFQSDIQGISKIFFGDRQAAEQPAVDICGSGGSRSVRFCTKRIAPVPFSAGERDRGVACVREPSGTVGNRREACYRFRIRPMT